MDKVLSRIKSIADFHVSNNERDAIGFKNAIAGMISFNADKIAEIEKLKSENSKMQGLIADAKMELSDVLANSKIELATMQATINTLQQSLDSSRETEKQLRIELSKPNNNEALLVTNAELQGRINGEREARAKADSIIQQTLNRFDDFIKMMSFEETKEPPVSYQLELKRDGNGVLRDVRVKPEV